MDRKELVRIAKKAIRKRGYRIADDEMALFIERDEYYFPDMEEFIFLCPGIAFLCVFDKAVNTLNVEAMIIRPFEDDNYRIEKDGRIKLL